MTTSVTYSWFMDPKLPVYDRRLPSQNTAFGDSSLASSSGSAIAIVEPNSLINLRRLNNGNGNANNLNIISSDKSTLGINYVMQSDGLRYSKPPPEWATVPNVRSLSRSTLLLPPQTQTGAGREMRGGEREDNEKM